MKNVLVIAYVFPPLAGSAVQRTLKFIKYLPDFGWMPTVLTVKPYYPWPATDATLLDEVPSAVEIARTYALEYRRLRVLLGRRKAPAAKGSPSGPGKTARGMFNSVASEVQRWLAVPDQHIGWLPFALASARNIIGRKQIDVVYSSFPPGTASLIAYMVSKRYGLPWVNDFRDAWTRREDYLTGMPSALHRRISRTLERKFVEAPSRVIAVTSMIKEEFLLDYPAVQPEKICCITNGFDEEDFRQADHTAAAKGAFTLLHAGLANEVEALGLRAFFNALKMLRRQGHEEVKAWRVRFVGEVSNAVGSEAKAAGIDDMVEYTGYVSHRESIHELLGASVLFLHRSEPNAYSSKIFEYLRAKKPLLALCPKDGVLAELIKESGAGIAVPTDNVDGISHALWKLYLDSCSDGKLYNVEEQFLARYERRELSGRLARVFDEVTAK